MGRRVVAYHGDDTLVASQSPKLIFAMVVICLVGKYWWACRVLKLEKASRLKSLNGRSLSVGPVRQPQNLDPALRRFPCLPNLVGPAPSGSSKFAYRAYILLPSESSSLDVNSRTDEISTTDRPVDSIETK
jgi:hypothetical protein